MSSTKYTYSVSTDFPNHAVNVDRLTLEIAHSAIIIALDYISVSEDVCDIWFKDELSAGDETILDGVVAAHSGEPIVPGPEKVQIAGFPDMGSWYYWKKGFRWELTAGETNLKDVKFDESLRLSGGGYYVPATSHEGDYVEFQIVDVDGLYYPAGTVLSTFISTDYVWDGKGFDVQMADAVLVYAGLYLRLKYVSTGTENVVVYTWYHMRHISG